eukprot:UN28109
MTCSLDNCFSIMFYVILQIFFVWFVVHYVVVELVVLYY